MPLGDFGLSQAFTVKTNASEAANNQIEDMKYAEQIRRQNEAMAMAKAKMFADDIEFQNGSNDYDSTIIKKENGDMLKKLGDLKNNPSYWTDRNLQAQAKLIKNDFKQTKAVLRSAAWKDTMAKYNAFSKEALDNPTEYNLDQLEAFKKQVANYGKDASGNYLPSDQVEALVFNQPEKLANVDKLERELGAALEPQTYESLKNGRDGSFIGYLNDTDALEQAKGIYKNNQSTYNYKNKGKAPEEIVSGIAERLKSFVPIKYDIGDRNPVDDALAIEAGRARIKAIADAKSTGRPVDPYALLLNDRYTKDEPKTLAATFGTSVPYSYTDANGNLRQGKGRDFNYDGVIFDKGYRKDGKYQRTGIKVTPGYIEETLQWGKDEGFLTKPMWGEPKVKPEFENRVKIVNGPIGDDGKASRILQVDAFNEIPANDAKWALKYNKQFTTTDQRNSLGINESMLENDSPATVTGTKAQFKAKGWTDEMIKKYSDSGQIIVK
jgi:hypothetical protein